MTHPINWTGGNRRGRAGSVWGVLFLVAIVAIIVAARMLSNQETRKRQANIMRAMEDPQTMIQRFFIEASKEQPYKEKGWETLLEFMSKDDLAWFETNYPLIAQTSQKMEGALAMAATEREQRYGATDVLLGLSTPQKQPTISQVQVNGDRGAVFVHQPGNVSTMRVIFVARDGDYWKIRRFLGRRDEYTLMKMLVETHEYSNTPLTDDETMFKADPQNYPIKKHNELMAEAGLTPDQKLNEPAPTATP